MTQSSFMFLVLCNEAFGYTHERTLDSDLALVMSMLREHGYLVNDRNKSLLVDDDESGDNHGEWVEVIDFDTGKKKRVRRMRAHPIISGGIFRLIYISFQPAT